jgi:hypothetical protein
MMTMTMTIYWQGRTKKKSAKQLASMGDENCGKDRG